MSTTDQAWRQYQEVVSQTRDKMLASRWAVDDVSRTQAKYAIQMLQTFAFNIYTAPRQNYPVFYNQSIFMPYEMGFGAPCPDFRYLWAFLDGRRTYRIRAKLGTTRWCEFQAVRGFWGDPEQKHLGGWDFDDFVTEDGYFEAIASPTPQEKNWIQLDPTAHNITLMLREAWYDWDNETGIELSIECIDRPVDSPMVHTPEAFDRRLYLAGELVRFSVEFFLNLNDRIVEGAGGLNRFWAEPIGDSTNVGGNPRASYPKVMYDLQPDEALIIECEIPTTRYWSIQLGDAWFQTTDYAYHHSSLNGHQAHVDADGKVRIVLSKEDPGTPNWLDPVDNLQGLAQWRWYLSEKHLVPDARVVKTADVWSHLPGGSPRVSKEERAAVIERRRAATLRRFQLAL